MIKNHFYEKKGPYPLNEIIKVISSDNKFDNKNNIEIHGFESLTNATQSDITFLNSQKYKNFSLNTKAAACITTANLSKFLPKNCIKLNVKNVLFAVTQASKMFYPNADFDLPDKTLQDFNKMKKNYIDIKCGVNVLIGKNVKIGKNSFIGSNSIIESNVCLGENCVIQRGVPRLCGNTYASICL